MAGYGTNKDHDLSSLFVISRCPRSTLAAIGRSDLPKPLSQVSVGAPQANGICGTNIQGSSLEFIQLFPPHDMWHKCKHSFFVLDLGTFLREEVFQDRYLRKPLESRSTTSCLLGPTCLRED